MLLRPGSGISLKCTAGCYCLSSFIICWLLAVLGLRCSVDFPLVAEGGGSSPAALPRVLTEATSLVEPGSRGCGLQEL